MQNELLINNKDAYTEWGVSMGNGFLTALDTPPKLKSYVKNESRAEHGSRYVIPTTNYMAEREVTLAFVVIGATPAEYTTRKNAFLAELQKGKLTVKVPQLDGNTYNLIYTGNGISYALNTKRTVGKFSAKFIEPDPTDRGTVKLAMAMLTPNGIEGAETTEDAEPIED